jgi:hypothetical protein
LLNERCGNDPAATLPVIGTPSGDLHSLRDRHLAPHDEHPR